MKTKTIFYGLSLLLISMMSSCSTYKHNEVYNPASYSVLIDGYWGKWENLHEPFGSSYMDEYLYRVQTRYDADSFEILIYGKNQHPSNFKAKIIIDKTTEVQKDKVWTAYQGTITTKKLPLSLASDNYVIYGGVDSSDYQTLKCEIRCDKDMRKAIQKNGLLGTINVFYGNGKGDAITFK